jgi:hypothetical protein
MESDLLNRRLSCRYHKEVDSNSSQTALLRPSLVKRPAYVQPVKPSYPGLLSAKYYAFFLMLLS